MTELLLLNQALGNIVSITPNIVPLATKQLPVTSEQENEWQKTEESEEVEFAFEQAHQLLNRKIANGEAIPTLLSVKEGDTLKQDTIAKLRRELSDVYWIYKAYVNVLSMTVRTWDDKDPIDPECTELVEKSPELFELLETSGAVFEVDVPVPEWLIKAQQIVTSLNAIIISHEETVRSADTAQDEFFELFEQMNKALVLLDDVLQRQTTPQNVGASK
jgi:hypothetical protein